MGGNSSKKKQANAAAAAVAEPSPSDVPDHVEENMPPKSEEYVYTPYGPGYVESYREETQMYVIVMKWRLANDCRVRSYVKAEFVSKDPQVVMVPAARTPMQKKKSLTLPAILSKEPSTKKRILSRRMSARDSLATVYGQGLRVTTSYGPGVVVTYRVATGQYVVRLDWKLANALNAMAYLCPKDVSRERKADIGDYVVTQYGTGRVEGFRPSDGAHRVRLTQLQGGAVAYLQADAIHGKMKCSVGTTIDTQYGPGVCEMYRPVDDIYVVTMRFGRAFMCSDAVRGVLSAEQVGSARDGCKVM